MSNTGKSNRPTNSRLVLGQKVKTEKASQAALAVLADEYTKLKSEFHQALTAADNLPCQLRSDRVLEVERALEHAFERLCASKPSGFDDILTKASVFIDEILNDADLETYQKQSLLCLLDDIRSFTKPSSPNS